MVQSDIRIMSTGGAIVTAELLLPAGPQPRGAATLVRGPLRYMHYSVDGYADHGWGCGYRTVQTIMSWLAPDAEPHSIPEIRRLLAEQQDDPGPRGWIGCQEAVILLDRPRGRDMVSARVVLRHVRSGAEASVLLPELAAHFAAGGGPCMVGGGGDAYSKTVVGVALPVEGGGGGGGGGRDEGSPSSIHDEGSLLVWDPHYAGGASRTADTLAPSRRALWDGGWVAWRPLSDALRADSFYNVALPQRVSAGGSDAGVAAGATAAAAPPPAGGWESLFEVVDDGTGGAAAGRPRGGSRADTAAPAPDWASQIEIVGGGSEG